MSEQGQGVARRLGSVARIRNRGVMGLLVRQCRRNSILGVEHNCNIGDTQGKTKERRPVLRGDSY